MSETEPESFSDVDSALLDVDLFLKYSALDRAVERLREALDRNPRSLQLRERLRSISAQSNPEECARQCLALASIYIEREDFQTAHDRLIQAKQLNPRINIAPGLNAIRRARHPDVQQQTASLPKESAISHNALLAGDLLAISIFDAIQVLENARLTGTLKIDSGSIEGSVFFNEGRIVGANAGIASGEEAFRNVIEATSGTFEFIKSLGTFEVTINAVGNTNLILDSLRQLDEERS
jgi:tetratricopeptide (TPR) repeat protein